MYDRKAKIRGTFQVYQIGEDRAVFLRYNDRSESKIKSKLNELMPFITSTLKSLAIRAI